MQGYIGYTGTAESTKEENVSLQKQKDIRQYICSDEVSKTVNPEKQSRHIIGSAGYIKGRSYLLPGVDAQELVDKYHGTGKIRLNRAGDAWINKELVVADRDIGVSINHRTGEETVTNRFTIHYSNTGTHVVPTERKE